MFFRNYCSVVMIPLNGVSSSWQPCAPFTSLLLPLFCLFPKKGDHCQRHYSAYSISWLIAESLRNHYCEAILTLQIESGKFCLYIYLLLRTIICTWRNKIPMYLLYPLIAPLLKSFPLSPLHRIWGKPLKLVMYLHAISQSCLWRDHEAE